MGVIRAISKWCRPYLYDNEIIEEQKEIKQKKKKVKVSKLTKADKKATELDAVKRGELGVKIITVNNELDKSLAFQRADKSDTHIAYYYHSSDRHQFVVKFEPNSGYRYYQRNDSKRHKLKPFIYPKAKTYDKTHLIPIGFHGSDSDPRLLVGWSSKQNRGVIKKLETKVTAINKDHTIIWFVDIEKLDRGAKWTTSVWFEDGELLDEKVFQDRTSFHWPI